MMQILREKERESKKLDVLQIPFVRFLLYLLVGSMFLYVGLTTVSLQIGKLEVGAAITLTGIGLVLFGIWQLVRKYA